MLKKIIGSAILLLLIGIVIFNVMEENSNNANDSNLYDVTGDPNTSGVTIFSEGETGISKGEVAPEIALETLAGEQFRLSDLQGKKVILNFWYTWCPPCKEEMPEMQKFYDEHKDEVEIVAVNLTNMEKKQQDIHDFVDEYGYDFIIPLDPNAVISDEYKVVAAPTTYFIGTDGVVGQERKLGPMTYEFMEEMVDGLN
ncbi:TlpA family protein disulfide reductase [Oceanobacillus bengalensis]|uniref:TlpA family protein disulfide reductase n=1 Tax=Oceanobacillus bengalensis TaxID=1435466 RepID=A0A494YSU7_9BACI|nr:TlpA disulfide reductase family protein [Oceanobacillus bengalensis]RKQ13163.1 TlpA family protein disulfide reductase [Oceanobacillus bengalensis]